MRLLVAAISTIALAPQPTQQRRPFPSSAPGRESAGHGLHGGLAHASGLVRQHAHLDLEKFGLDQHRIVLILCLDQLVAEVERRPDVALHEVPVLIGVIGEGNCEELSPFSSIWKYSLLALRTRARFSVSMFRTFSADIGWSAMALSLS